MSQQHVVNYFTNSFSLGLNVRFIPTQHSVNKASIGNIEYRLSTLIDPNKNNNINSLRLSFRSDTKQDFVNAANNLITYFGLNTPRVNIDHDFRNSYVVLLENDFNTQSELKIIFRDRESYLMEQYEVELILENY